MTSKNSIAEPWSSKTQSHYSTQLLQPRASTSGMAHRAVLSTMAPYELHKRLINDYFLYRKDATALLQRDTSRDKTDFDVIQENHRFLWDDSEHPDTWEAQLAKKYYDKLYKEYCICDLTVYKHNKVAMRWRTEAELISGSGQFTCSEKHCNGRDGLRTWEVNFAYTEHGEKKNALVKLRLCPECSSKLNYGSKKREVKRLKKRKQNHKPHIIKNDGEKTSKKRENIAEEGSLENEVEQENTEKDEENDDRNVWRNSGKQDEEKAREDEFEEYLEDLLM